MVNRQFYQLVVMYGHELFTPANRSLKLTFMPKHEETNQTLPQTTKEGGGVEEIGLVELS